MGLNQKASEIAKQIGFDSFEAIVFCAKLLEEVNEHNLSNALTCIISEQYNLSKDWITLDEAQTQMGELTPALKVIRDSLLAKIT